MRFVQPEPRISPKDIASRSYDINIRLSGADSVLIEPLIVKIERHLRNIYSLQQTMRIRTFFILRVQSAIQRQSTSNCFKKISVFGTFCHAFGEAQDIGNRIVHVDARPNKTLDDPEFRRLRGLWSNAPWKLIYDGPGAAAGP